MLTGWFIIILRAVISSWRQNRSDEVFLWKQTHTLFKESLALTTTLPIVTIQVYVKRSNHFRISGLAFPEPDIPVLSQVHDPQIHLVRIPSQIRTPAQVPPHTDPRPLGDYPPILTPGYHPITRWVDRSDELKRHFHLWLLSISTCLQGMGASLVLSPWHCFFLCCWKLKLHLYAWRQCEVSIKNLLKNICLWLQSVAISVTSVVVHSTWGGRDLQKTSISKKPKEMQI